MPAPRSRWSVLRLQRRALEQDLRRRHSLRLHGWLIGALTLALTWGGSALLRQAGVHSLALRYLLALAVGYGAYLLVLRCWALWLLRPASAGRVRAGDALDAAETGVDAAQGLRALLPEAQGGDAAQGAAQLGEALGLAGAVDEGAVALGAAVDHWLPQARSLPEALRALHLAAPR
ncbi:hypothetical protein [Comamonas flocculans]|uniref:Uncharacterized protein n=1 Tax=Comamonas flocculans TaxID=2597701 RepID=A0A5B8RTS9_9BURK|nr:hypothetical protein [Comamonas flocculans]QEA12966.1 hypothetical protein FOZ74_07955 [Comamonas flocculans]